MRILQFLTHDRIESGGAQQAFLLARELVRRGHAVTVAMGIDERSIEADTRAKIEGAGCECVGIPVRGFAAFLRATKAIERVGRRVDVVHLHREHALARFVAAEKRVPNLAAVANIGTSTKPNRAHAARLAHPRIHRVVCVAEALREMIIDTAGVSEERAITVHGAFDEDRFDERATPRRASELGAPEGSRIVGVVANLDNKKGHRRFLEAAKIVLSRYPDTYFAWAGAGDIDGLKAMAREIGRDVFDHLLALGFREDVPSVLRCFDVSVSASTRGEGLSGAMRESLAMGVPVVCTDVGGNREIVRDGETGRLVPPRDSAALANAICDLLEHRDAALAMASRGRAEVRARFGCRARAAKMETVYAAVIAELRNR